MSQEIKSKSRTRVGGVLRGIGGVSLLALCYLPNALAQDAASSDAEVDAQKTLNTVVVTSTKREQSIQDVAASITAFDADKIALTEVQNSRDLQFAIPGLITGNGNGTSQIAIRGIGANSSSGVDDPAVAQHIDGVYQPRTQAVLLAVSDLERIEVLKGPQGTLYGRNSTGGAINYITAKPTDEFEANVEATVGNFNRYGVKGAISGPLGENVAARASVLYNHRDGYVDTFGGGEDFRGDETLGGRFSLRFTPDETLTVDLAASAIETEALLGWQITEVVNPITAFYLAPGNFTTEVNEVFSELTNTDGLIDQKSLTATIGWDVNEWLSLKSITGYIDNGFKQTNFDTDYSSSVIFSSPASNFSSGETFQQEVNFNADLFNDRVNAVGGVFYLKDDVTYDSAFPAFGLFSTFDQSGEAWAVFADATVELTDQVRLIGGMRYTEEEKELVQTNTFFCPVAQTPSDKWTNFSPKVGVQVDASENVMFYGTWQEGFKAGGFDTASCSDVFDPEEIEAIEIGVKMTLFNGRSIFNASIFDYDYSDLQVQQLNGFFTEVSNAGAATVTGAEFEFNTLVGDTLSFEVSGTYLDATFDEFMLNDSLAPGPAIDLSGTRLRRAPEFSGTVALQNEVDTEIGAFTFRGEAYYSSEVLYDFFGREGERQGSFSTQNVYVTYQPAWADSLQVKGFVKNISDEEVLTGAVSAGALGLKLGNYSIGRTYGVSISKSF